MMQLSLIELADLPRPDLLVAEILRQNPQLPIPVPVEELARAAGITQIEAFTTEGFEGALVTDATKSRGAIFYNGRSLVLPPYSRTRPIRNVAPGVGNERGAAAHCDAA